MQHSLFWDFQILQNPQNLKIILDLGRKNALKVYSTKEYRDSANLLFISSATS